MPDLCNSEFAEAARPVRLLGIDFDGVMTGGTFGSEPHMPFGGVRASGNGTREPGTEAIDVYTELKDIYLLTDPERL